MQKTMIVYWSQSGNTAKMAEAIFEGAKETCGDVELKQVSEVTPDDLKALDGFALGCPAMGAEVLEEEEMEPFVCEVEKFAGGKKIALFGSYGWGDGEWMRDWQERMVNAGATVIDGEGLIINDCPDDAGLDKCRDLGRNLGMA